VSIEGGPPASRRRRRAWAAAIIAFLAPVPAAATLAAAEVRWSARLAFDERYDDNITQLSPKNLDRLDTQGGGHGIECGSGSTDTRGGRFSIEAPGDYISMPQFSGSIRAGWLEGRPTAIDLSIAAYKFARSPIKDWQSFRLEASQPLHRGKFETRVGLSYGYVPYYYYRNLRSDRTADELGVLPPPRRETTYRSHTTAVHVDQVLVPRYLWFSGLAGREGKDYNRCFDERDSEMPLRQFELAWHPLGDQLLRVRASFRREDLHSAGDIPETLFFTEPDTSSRREIWSGDLRVRWGRQGRKTTLSLRYEAERREYSTTNPNDIFHFERIDQRRHTTVAAHVELRRNWFLTAEAERSTNRSSFPTPPGITFLPEDTTDFNENLYQFGFGHDFGVDGSAGSRGPQERSRE